MSTPYAWPRLIYFLRKGASLSLVLTRMASSGYMSTTLIVSSNVSYHYPSLHWSLPDPESKGGQRLLCQTEFRGQTEYRSSYLIARRPENVGSDAEIPQAKLICGMCEGAFTCWSVLIGSLSSSQRWHGRNTVFIDLRRRSNFQKTSSTSGTTHS